MTIRTLSAPKHRVFRGLTSGDPSVLRTATLYGRSHLIVPVTALIGDTVVHPINAPTPEFVPAAELAATPGGWNGRVIVPDHPAEGSANSPTVLEAQAFGTVFNARFDADTYELLMDVWLDEERAETVGDLALDVIRRCRAGEPVEVSVGVYVQMEESAGVHNGKRYGAIWHNPVPDHLAMLPAGTEGACSIEMGCGTKTDSDTDSATNSLSTLEARMETPSFLQRALTAIRNLGLAPVDDPSDHESRTLMGPDGMSDHEMKYRISEALRAILPGFSYVECIYPATKTAVCSARVDDRYRNYRFAYNFSKDGKVSVSGGTEVEYGYVDVVGAKPPALATLAAGTQDGAKLRTACGCGGNGGSSKSASTSGATIQSVEKSASAAGCSCGTEIRGQAAHNIEGDSTMTKLQQLAGRLIASPKAPQFTEADRKTLEALGETQLEAIANALAPEEKPAEGGDTAAGSAPATPAAQTAAPATVAPAAPAATPAPLTLEAWLGSAPAGVGDELRALMADGRAARASEKTALVRVLTRAQDHLTAEQLTAMQIDQLRTLAGVLGVGATAAPGTPDFSGARILGASHNDGTEPAEAPQIYTLALAEAAKQKAGGAN